MAETQMSLTVEQREFLVHLLESQLKAKRVEEHRTRAPSYREHVLREENLIAELLNKLSQPVG